MEERMLDLLVVCCLLVGSACTDQGMSRDAALPDGGADTGRDAALDSGSADAEPRDASHDATDSEIVPDAGAPDGTVDAGLADAGAPSAEVLFPPAISLTDGDRVQVRGTATAPSGVVAVRVNGVDAMTTDGFLTWNADVSLHEGPNLLSVTMDTGRGTPVGDVDAVTVTRSSSFFDSLHGVEWSPSGALYVMDDGLATLFSVDALTGARRVVSGPGVGTGPPLVNPRAVRWDMLRSQLLTLDDWGTTLVAIDPTSGDRTLVSGPSIGAGDPFRQASDLAVDGAGTAAYVTTPTSLIEIDLDTGDRRHLAGEPMIGVELDTDRSRLLFVDRLGQLAAYEIADGTISQVSGDATGSGPPFERPIGVRLADTGDSAYVLETDALLAVDLTTGNRSIVSARGAGAGPGIPGLAFLAVHGSQIVAGVPYLRAIINIDPVTGDRAVVSGHLLGAGTHFGQPTDIVRQASMLYAVDRLLDALISLSTDGGDRTIVSGTEMNRYLELDVGGGPAFPRPQSLGLDASGVAWVYFGTLGPARGLSEVTLATGDRSTPVTGFSPGSRVAADSSRRRSVVASGSSVLGVALGAGVPTTISNDTTGTGPAIVGGQDITVDVTNDRYLIAASAGTLLEVDPGTGNRRVLASSSVGTGRDLVVPWYIDVNATGTAVVASSEAALVSVDLVTGNRTIISDETHAGPVLTRPSGLAWDETRGIVFVADIVEGILAVDVDSGQRVIISR